MSYNEEQAMLNRFHNRLNECFFSGELKKVRLDFRNINKSDFRNDALGVFYRPFEGENFLDTPLIAIDRDLFDNICNGRDNEKWITCIVSTLLHEMVHQYCYENEIVDVDKDNGKHTEQFANVASEHGLMASRTDNNDYRITFLDPDFWEVWDELGATYEGLV